MPEIIPCRICGQPACGGVDLLAATPHGYDDELLTIPLCASCQTHLAQIVAAWVERQAEERNDGLRPLPPRIAGGVMEKYPWDERDQNPEQARREAWRFLRWLVVGWVLLLWGGCAVLEVF